MIKINKIEIRDFFMNDQNTLFGYPPPMEKLEKLENVSQLILMNVTKIYYRPIYT